MSIQEIIAPLGHTIIALSEPPTNGSDSQAWSTYLNNVSSALEQRGAILIAPFSNVDDAQEFAAQASIDTNYRIVAACYHGADDQLSEIAASVAAAFADSNDPAVPFNNYNLPGLNPVEPQYDLLNERIEAALSAGVCMLRTGPDGVPEIIRAICTYQNNAETGEPDGLLPDINGALILDYVRKVVRAAVRANGRRKNTARERKNLRSLILVELLKLEEAEILQNVRERANELVVAEDTTDRSRVNVKIPADWVRGMHVIAAQLDVY
ncbi:MULTISPECIES: phage tail sheath C-terminal domain-containing protein [unclassified Acinetobacter]|uniref:phage tail sheath C-terminal domain-containing protein n=1 Tax=unclassified Acinetobacter TaxID=196816 RepID=UPI0019098448|nr:MULTISPECIES: phage tail sheath C-terminal domain-containing protein [unclassified Acinetobacter]MBK0062384.1 phage tail protein [Acinetobacter sp. S55]MBK0066188.1 phage tail protein [Acinetobacter sp. S54]